MTSGAGHDESMTRRSFLEIGLKRRLTRRPKSIGHRKAVRQDDGHLAADEFCRHPRNPLILSPTGLPTRGQALRASGSAHMKPSAFRIERLLAKVEAELVPPPSPMAAGHRRRRRGGRGDERKRRRLLSRWPAILKMPAARLRTSTG
jgi:hypothetical protein